MPENIEEITNVFGFEIRVVMTFQIIAGLASKIIRQIDIKDSEDYLFIMRLFHQYGGIYLMVSSNISIISFFLKFGSYMQLLLVIHYSSSLS
jgi:hypothetical protein